MTTRIWHSTIAALFILSVAACSEEAASPTTPSTDPVALTFSSEIAPRGSAARAFTAGNPGTVSVTLTSLAPDAIVGLGVGIPLSNGTGCHLSQSVETGTGGNPQLVMTADAGDYCVRVFDTGTLTERVRFSVNVVHP